MFYLTRTILLAVCLTILSALPFVVAQENRSNDLFEIKVNGKTGFIDRIGKIVIEPKLNGVYEFSEGLAAAYVDKGQFDEGYIDETGAIAIEPKFNIASKFSEGFAWVGIDPERIPYTSRGMTLHSSQSTHSFKYNIGFIDKSGRWITDPVFIYAEDFSEGLAAVRTKENKFGFINRNGNLSIQPKYEWAGSFHEGLAWVFVNGKYGFIDRSGTIVIKPQFTKAKDFSEGLACVKIGGQVREPGFGTGSITTTNSDTNFAYIDKKGEIVFRVTAYDCDSFSEGLARFEIAGSWGFIDRQGKILVSPAINAIGDFSEGLALVLLPGDKESFGFIDKNGKVVIRTNYSVVDDFRNGLAQVRQDDPENSSNIVYSRYGYIDKTGKVIWKPSR